MDDQLDRAERLQKGGDKNETEPSNSGCKAGRFFTRCVGQRTTKNKGATMNTEDEKRTAVLEPQAKAKPAPEKHDDSWGEEEEVKTGFRKWFMPIVVTVVSVVGVYSVGKKLMNADSGSAKKEAGAEKFIVLPIQPPPVATPPPPPPKEEVREDKQVDEKEDQAPEPEPAVTSAAAGKGTGGIQIAKGNGAGFFPKRANTDGQTKWKGFSSQVAKTIEDALRRNPATKTAAGSAPVVRVWTDANGRITRVSVESSTGNTAVDNVINQGLVGLQCPGVTPTDMPQPIRLRITLKRPN
jgi:periplasmic protein TonB